MSVNFDENFFVDTEDYDVNGMEMPVSKEELANGSKQMRECDEAWLYIFAFVKAFANKENVPFRLEDWDSLKLIASVDLSILEFLYILSIPVINLKEIFRI